MYNQFPKQKVNCWRCNAELLRFVAKGKRYICEKCKKQEESDRYYRMAYGIERSELAKEVKKEIYGEDLQYSINNVIIQEVK